MTDQEAINLLASHLRAGRYGDAAELARTLHDTCDRTGVLLQWLSVAELLAAVESVARRVEAAQLLDCPISSVPLDASACPNCGRSGEGPTCPVCDPDDDDDDINDTRGGVA